MAIDTQELPVAAVRWIVIVVMIAVVYREFTQIFPRKLTPATSTDPGIELESALAVVLLSLVAFPVRIRNDTIEFILVRLFFYWSHNEVTLDRASSKRKNRVYTTLNANTVTLSPPAILFSCQVIRQPE